MSYVEPIDTRLVQVVLDDLEDNNNHTLCELLAAAYGIPWSVPEIVADTALLAAREVMEQHRLEVRNKQLQHWDKLDEFVRSQNV